MSSEEDRARALLYEMQTRLAAGPHAALGIPSHATAADIRNAFLQLTKQFHPAKFARMSHGTQKLSNEIFLSLKAAHEMLAHPKPPPSRRQTPSNAPANRPSTRPFGVPIQPTTPSHGTRASAPAIPQRPAVAPPSRSSPATPGRTQSATTPAPNAPPPARQSTPAMRPPQPTSSTPPTGIRIGSPVPPRTGQSQAIQRPLAGQSQSMPKVNSTSSSEALDPALAPILEMMGRNDWDRAQHAIDQLAMRNPQSNRYQAMSSYCRGKRAMNERRYDDARVELQTALMQDNTLDLAKSAITELMIAARRR